MKKIFLLSFLMALFFSACSNPSSNENSIEKIKQQGVIRIGVFGDKPPFGYLDTQGKNQGYDVYFAKRIAKELLGDESKVQFVLVEAANRVEFLESNKVDVILANFTKTPEREAVVDFAFPYMKVALGVVAPKGSDIKTIDDLKSKTLILNKGTTADAYFTKNMPEIKTIKFDQNTETFAALIGKRGDALSHDNALLFAWAKENPNFEVVIKELGNHDVIAPAVKKGDEAMLKFINDLIVKLQNEQFFHKAYDETLKPFFSDDIKADDVVIEGGKI
ncbi:TPA: cysteine ABC transporter substrate-binding protein [Campylobacter lari]|nr:cysteine ABC transporter substrate-binding protein [Campylobacter lari]MCR6559537.1 cysteine ABC transporter substrate-binding protein [Campylobacter lari]MCV3405463.1 cysteine ABC transporter substrate-binding protein [Campylobacter lari]HEC1783318.1 cysteine ABC transporter substrate-binding protein [Campylobacter lari]